VAVLLLAVPAAASTSGLRGVVTRGPITPVCSAERPCSAPAQRIELTFVRRGHTWTTKTDDHGRYRIVLRPGVYSVTVATQRPGLPAFKATVPRGRVGVRNFTIDTGIR
jgi:hypothetical protein